jgi:hypothetical protein
MPGGDGSGKSQYLVVFTAETVVFVALELLDERLQTKAAQQFRDTQSRVLGSLSPTIIGGTPTGRRCGVADC